MELELLGETFAVCRLPVAGPLPQWLGGGFYSLTVTPTEVSVVCEEARVPVGTQAERDWRCLRVRGTLDFALVGVLASLLTPLARAEVSVFAISTFDTDYLLVKRDKLAVALAALEGSGHHLVGAGVEAGVGAASV